MMDRRTAITKAAAFAFYGAMLAGTAGRSAASAKKQVVQVVAQRFKFTPEEIHLKAGEAAELQVTSLDFIHGFNCPGLGIRTNLLPGPPTKIAIKALPPGSYPFLCDNFCGDGHEEMNGVIVVS